MDKRRAQVDLFSFGGADFDGEYRYDLFRIWDEKNPMLLFVMLNPSTADEKTLDRTVNRCKGFAQALGYGGFHVANLFALISTKPSALKEAKDPVGPLNGRYIGKLAKQADKVIVAWGSDTMVNDRAPKVLKLLHKYHKKIYCLGTNKDGHPRHPLYLCSTTEPVIYES
ncbi:MAG: DUF1643 domain-containing protein [Candidatus Omnitrophica bacterium]|nr:DUF1643 domain-containing protein [Candidatus Omnitrophota bacterium]